MAGLLLALPIQNGHAAPVNFEEYKQLSAKEQDALFEDLDNPRHFTFLEWNRRLALGEAEWKIKEQKRLIGKKGLTPLLSFFNDYQHLQESFLQQDFERKVAVGMSATEQSAEFKTLGEKLKALGILYHDAVPVVATLAKTNETLILTKTAHDLTVKWDKERLLGGKWLITREDISAINQDAQNILNQLDKLPIITPQEEQTELDALPLEDPSK